MALPTRLLLHQRPVLRALASAALAGLRPRTGAVPETPGPFTEVELPPRPDELVQAYVRHLGGDPSSYRDRVPAHLFPQWSFPLAAQAFAGLPWPLLRVVNAGCRIEQHAPLPAREPLVVRARLASVDVDERRALLVHECWTGTRASPDAVRSELRALVPLGKPARGAARERPRVPEGAREIAWLDVRADAGLDFAKLTGDVNPIHWLAPWARKSGFRGCILHGFATLGRAVEAMNRALFAGDPSRLAAVDVRFTRPLLLPAKVGVYVSAERGLWVGDAPSGGAYLEGTYETEKVR